MKATHHLTQFNLNYLVYVKLTDHGYNQFLAYLNRYDPAYATMESLRRSADKEGYVAIQGWAFMEALGGIYSSAPRAFDMNIRLHPEGIIKPK